MYHVCHKCGLSRARAKTDPDLGSCICIGQTWFEYEELERTAVETKELGLAAYQRWVELYNRQDLRTKRDYQRLAQQYAKVLA